MHAKVLHDVIAAVVVVGGIACFGGALYNWWRFARSIGKSPFVRVIPGDLRGLTPTSRRYYSLHMKCLLGFVICIAAGFFGQLWIQQL